MKDYSVLLTCGETAMVIVHDAFDKGYEQGYKDGKSEQKPTNDYLPHCQHTDEEIAKSFIEDVKAVKDRLPTTNETPNQEAKWIPVTERLPEEPGTYLVTLGYKGHGTGITTLWFHGSLGWDLRVADVVTAWMPLPEAYKAESEG